jgi:hypothetical protein
MVALPAFVQLLAALIVHVRASEPLMRRPVVIVWVTGLPVMPSMAVTLRLLAVQPTVKRWATTGSN